MRKQHFQWEKTVELNLREKLQREKIDLERDNRKLRTQTEELREKLKKISLERSSLYDRELERVQGEMREKGRELGELRQAHGRVQKIVAEKGTELAHALRKVDGLEREVSLYSIEEVNLLGVENLGKNTFAYL